MRLELKDYDFTVEYLKGKDNYVADALQVYKTLLEI